MRVKYSVVEPYRKILHLQTNDFEEAANYVNNYNFYRKSFKVVIIKTIVQEEK